MSKPIPKNKSILSKLEQNYFKLFGLPVQFSIDLSELAIRYRELQKQFHPDKFVSGSDAERRMTSQIAAQINAGYQVLKSPLQRGRYLLSLSGIEIDDEKDTKMDSAFLIEQMELRENLESVQSAADPFKAILVLSNEVDAGIRSRLGLLENLFSSDGQEILLQTRNVLRELQFLEKINKEVGQLEDDLI